MECREALRNYFRSLISRANQKKTCFIFVHIKHYTLDCDGKFGPTLSSARRSITFYFITSCPETIAVTKSVNSSTCPTRWSTLEGGWVKKCLYILYIIHCFLVVYLLLQQIMSSLDILSLPTKCTFCCFSDSIAEAIPER